MAPGSNYQPAPAATNALVPARELSAVLDSEASAGSRCAARVPESFHRNLRLPLSSQRSPVSQIVTCFLTNSDPVRGRCDGAPRGHLWSPVHTGPERDRAG